jgi:hypothetical protein
MVPLMCGEKISLDGFGITGHGVVEHSSTQMMGKDIVMEARILLDRYEATGPLGAFVVKSERGEEYRCTECRIQQRQEFNTHHTLMAGPKRIEGPRYYEMDAVFTNNEGRDRIIPDDWRPDERESLLDEILK